MRFDFSNFIRKLAVTCSLSILIGTGISCTSEEKEPPVPVTVGNQVQIKPSTSRERTFKVDSSPYLRGASLLEDYYQQKYDKKELSAVEKGLKEFLPDYSEQDLEDARKAIMSYQYVIYHRTDQHNLKRNHAVANQVESQISTICETLNVPFVPALAIVCWENSGDTSKVSYANAAGLGQMTDGAVEIAHQFGTSLAKEWRAEAARLRMSVERNDKIKAERLERGAKMADCVARHQDEVVRNKVKDERLIISCNLEDSILFLKYLLSKYGNRADLAVSAYHNGIANNDDIIYYYLRTVKGLDLEAETDPNRYGLLEALDLYDIKYIDLWNNQKTREILCGLRTVYGDKANEDNKDLVLRDESDLYPWKVISSYAGYKAGDQFVSDMQERYSGTLDYCETKDLPSYTSVEDLQAAFDGAMLCTIEKARYNNFGVDDIKIAEKKNKKPEVKLTEKKAAARKAAEKKAAERRAESMSQSVKDKCWYTTPELSGYLANLQRRWRLACGNTRVRLPLQNISGAWGYKMSRDACPVKGMQIHQKGVAVDLVLAKVPIAQRSILEKLILEDFLLDFVYIRRYSEGMHLVLNPSHGADFLDMYVQRVSPEGKIALAREELLEKENAKRKAEGDKDKSSSRDRDQAANMLNRERKVKKEAKSRASAAKKRLRREDKGEAPASKNEEELSINPTEEEEELYAIPDDVDNHNSGTVTSRKSTKESVNDVYSF